MKQRSIPNYIIEGYRRIPTPGQRVYMCNNLGRVINAKTGRKIKPFLSNSGYYMVTLNGRKYSVHRIVATLFVKKTFPFFNTVNHKNEIKTDNRAENLEWCGVLYNITYGNAQKKKKNSFIKIPVIAERNGEKHTYDSLSVASKATGVCISSIKRCIDGKQMATRDGYCFKENGRGPRCYIRKRIRAVKNGKDEVFESVIGASRKTGVSRAAIKYYITGRRQHQPKGYHFEFVT